MAEASSCKSEQSSLEKVTEGVATTSPPQKSEVTVPPVDTSSQASMEEAEGSLEDIPANISPIATIHSSGSTSPSVDLSELQANANRAIDNMLHPPVRLPYTTVHIRLGGCWPYPTIYY